MAGWLAASQPVNYCCLWLPYRRQLRLFPVTLPASYCYLRLTYRRYRYLPLAAVAVTSRYPLPLAYSRPVTVTVAMLE